jgi:hypothetical protein
MEPENINNETEVVEVEQVSRLHTVTPLSKYLALVLFVILPFLGGWIGYNYAPEKVVEIERVVVKEGSEVVTKDVYVDFKYGTYSCDYVSYVDDYCFEIIGILDSGEEEVVIDDLTKKYRQQFNTQEILREFYVDKEGNDLFFTTFILNSDGGGGLVKYNLETQTFNNLNSYLHGGSQQSPSGRYFTSSKKDDTISIIDVTKDEAVASVSVNEDETTTSTHCGSTGYWMEVEWLDDTTIEYGVYDKSSSEIDICSLILVEKRQLDISEELGDTVSKDEFVGAISTVIKKDDGYYLVSGGELRVNMVSYSIPEEDSLSKTIFELTEGSHRINKEYKISDNVDIELISYQRGENDDNRYYVDAGVLYDVYQGDIDKFYYYGVPGEDYPFEIIIVDDQVVSINQIYVE